MMGNSQPSVAKTIGISALVGVAAAGITYLLIHRPHLRGNAAAIARTALQVAEHLARRG